MLLLSRVSVGMFAAAFGLLKILFRLSKGFMLFADFSGMVGIDASETEADLFTGIYRFLTVNVPFLPS